MFVVNKDASKKFIKRFKREYKVEIAPGDLLKAKTDLVISCYSFDKRNFSTNPMTKKGKITVPKNSPVLFLECVFFEFGNNPAYKFLYANEVFYLCKTSSFENFANVFKTMFFQCDTNMQMADGQL